MNRADTYDSEVAIHEYEKLRANALGESTRANRFTLFLRDGMASWLRAMGNHVCAKHAATPDPSAAAGDLGADIPSARLAAILADAILNKVGSAVLLGGNL